MSVPFDEWLGGEAWMMDRMADFKRTTQDYWINEHVNTVLSFENLAEDWRSFCGLIGIEAELLHLNKGNYNGD